MDGALPKEKLDRASMCLWSTRCTNTCSGMVTGITSIEKTNQRQIWYPRITECGSKQQVESCTALHPMCTTRCWAIFRMQRC